MFELIETSSGKPGRRFQSDAAPVRLGRRLDLEIVLAEAGVFDIHAEIELGAGGWYVVRAAGQAIISVNDHPVTERRLRNGDVVGIGSAKLQFMIRPARQKSGRGYECAIWAMIVVALGGAAMAMIWIGR